MRWSSAVARALLPAKFAKGFVGECAGEGANQARSETPGFASVGILASGCGLDAGSCRDSDAEESRPKSDSSQRRLRRRLSFPIALYGFRLKSRNAHILLPAAALLRYARDVDALHQIPAMPAGLKAARKCDFRSSGTPRWGSGSCACGLVWCELSLLLSLCLCRGSCLLFAVFRCRASIAATMRIRLSSKTAWVSARPLRLCSRARKALRLTLSQRRRPPPAMRSMVNVAALVMGFVARAIAPLPRARRDGWWCGAAEPRTGERQRLREILWN